MKSKLHIILAVALTAGLAAAAAPGAWAFHDNGVAPCESCHVMHMNEEGTGMIVEVGGQLLRSDNPSDLCLGCHGSGSQGYGVLSNDVLNPEKAGKGAGGGDFVFLREDNLNDGAGGAANPIPGDRAGHNLFAPSNGLFPDATKVVSPGGYYPADKLTCTSCHDPHGGKQFRFLYGSDVEKGSTSHSLGYNFNYTDPAPVAEEMSVFATESNNNHNAYKSGMTNWCRACHKEVHKRGNFKHPRDHKLGGRARKYNRYNGTLDPDNGSLPDPYLALVPVEWNSTSNTTNSSGHIGEDARVMCLSCHRAHASSGPHSGRWDFNIATWADEGSSGSYPIENPYASSSGNDQRRLCEKCHGLQVPGP